MARVALMKFGHQLLRWSVLGLVAAWAIFAFLVLTSSDGGKAVDIAWPSVLLLPAAWAYVRPGVLSGVVAVVVAWPLAALTVTAMVVLPVIGVAEAMVIVAALRGEDRPVTATSPRGRVDPEA